MSATPQYASRPINAALQIQMANSARDGSGQVSTLYTADIAGAGARIDTIQLAAVNATTAGAVRFFLREPGAGMTWRFFREVPVTAAVPGPSAPAFSTELTNLALVVAPGWSLGVASERAEGLNVLVTNGGEL
ncbi:hypothetical protein [Microvirgula aerodenitrificans]|uniref:hypothetical protein n=1 Tax=Microvirgula aerodenitrificans TaxID=57480 RepID=UPI00048D0AA2|nr:hypothetical protein [Microvirgula aerodenitrificans]